MTPQASVVSVYFPNVDGVVVQAQRRAVYQFLPLGWEFIQYRYDPVSGDWAPHATAIRQCLGAVSHRIVVLLDIDCIPLMSGALEYLHDRASGGELVGAVQRANHLVNGAHLYVGPCCMAFDRNLYYDLGAPSFAHTQQGDTGEELTYRWEEQSRMVRFLWPTHVVSPRWALDGSCLFGLGTTYGSMFYHQFAIREGSGREQFLSKCQSVSKSIPQEV